MASQNVDFANIPSSIRKPGKYFEFNTSLAVRSLPVNKQKVLMVGQRLASGTVAANVPTEVFDDNQASLYFGRGSVAHLMCKAALIANPYIALSAVAMDDALLSAAATGTLTLSGTPTVSGLLTVNIEDVQIQIAVPANASLATVVENILTAFGQQLDRPVSVAAGGAGEVIFTAKNKGTLGNDLRVSASTTATGLVATMTAMTGGLVDPDIAPTLAAVAALDYNIVVCSLNDSASLTKLRTHLDFVSGPMEQRPAIGVAATINSLAAAQIVAAAVNSGRIVLANLPDVPEAQYELAAALGTVLAFEEDPARPLNTLPLLGVPVPPLASRLTRTQQESALYGGVTPLEVGPGNVVQIVRAISTYMLDPQGIQDPSLLDITTIRTLDYVRKACRDRIALRFPREKLSERTAPKVRSEILDVLYKLEELEIVELVDANKDSLIVERDLQDVNRLNAKIPTNVVNGLHVFAGRIDLIL
ncbi:MAG: phage tail sheath C-terminal domain-containing protein [Gallionella sp.]|nr:phage tail sheath C-terminal domain-containing protein [Gallionella sp.]